VTASLEDLRPFIDAGRHAYRNRAIGAYIAAIVALAITIAVAGARFYASGPIVLVAILALVGAGFHLWYVRLGWDRHPVLIALARAPREIVAADVLPAQGREALLDERQVELRSAAGATILLTVHRDSLAGLGRTLVDHCGAIRLRGFPSE